METESTVEQMSASCRHLHHPWHWSSSVQESSIGKPWTQIPALAHLSQDVLSSSAEAGSAYTALCLWDMASALPQSPPHTNLAMAHKHSQGTWLEGASWKVHLPKPEKPHRGDTQLLMHQGLRTEWWHPHLVSFSLFSLFH